MKITRFLSTILLVVVIGLFFLFELTPQDTDKTTKIQQENLSYYQNREKAASDEIKANLEHA